MARMPDSTQPSRRATCGPIGCVLLSVTMSALLVAPAYAGNRATQERQAKERQARAACLSGDYTKGVSILAQLFVTTKDPIDSYTCTPFRIDKTATAGTGTALTTYQSAGRGVIGNTLVLLPPPGMLHSYLCDVGTTCDPSDPAKQLPTGELVFFRSPTAPYFIMYTWGSSPAQLIFTWYSPTKNWLGNSNILGHGNVYIGGVWTSATTTFPAATPPTRSSRTPRASTTSTPRGISAAVRPRPAPAISLCPRPRGRV
jgi:hypothetical protein